MAIAVPVSAGVRSSIPDINPAHFGARHLRFAYNGNAVGRSVRGVAGADKTPMTQVGTSGVAMCRDGLGVLCDAADTGFYTVVRDPGVYATGITMMWRGVLLGAPGASNSGSLGGVYYGNGTSNPYSVFTMERSNSSADTLLLISNAGGSYIISSTDVGLSALYSRPITIVASHAPGTTALDCYIYGNGYAARANMNVFAAATNNPLTTSATDRIYIGCNNGAGRHPNANCTAMAIWSRAFTLTQLRELAANHADVFAPNYEAFLSTASPAPTPSGQLLKFIQIHGAFVQ